MRIFDLLSYSFGSVIGGLITSLFIVAVLLLIAFKKSRKDNIEGWSIMCSIVLFCMLFFQTTLLYAATSCRNAALSFISTYQGHLGKIIDSEELKVNITELSSENPMISSFVDYTDLDQLDLANPLQPILDSINKQYNSFLFRRLMWSLSFIGILGAGIIFPSFSGTGKSCRRKSKYHSHSRYTYSDFE